MTISLTYSPAPYSRHSRRNATLVMPAIGASTTGGSTAVGRPQRVSSAHCPPSIAIAGPQWSGTAKAVSSQPRSSATRAASARVRVAGLADGRRQVVADRPLGQEQRAGDVRDGAAVAGDLEHVALAGGQRVVAGGQRLGGQRRVDDPQPRVHPADRVGQLVGRRVLDHEPARAGLHRPPQVARAAERGDTSTGTSGTRDAQRPRWRRCRRCPASRRRAARRRAGARAPPRRPRRRGPPRRPPRGRAPARAGRTARPGRGAGRRRAAGGSCERRLANGSGTGAVRHRARAGRAAVGPGPASSRPPARPPARAARAGRAPARAATRSGAGPRRDRSSSTTSTDVAATRTLHRSRGLCRSTLVTPFAHGAAEQPRWSPGTSSTACGQVGLDARRWPGRPGPRTARRPASPRGSRPTVARRSRERLARQPLDVGDLGVGALRVDA